MHATATSMQKARMLPRARPAWRSRRPIVIVAGIDPPAPRPLLLAIRTPPRA
jgi:hypothetical protein